MSSRLSRQLLLAPMAISALSALPAAAQTAPDGGVLYLQSGTPPSVGSYTQYSVTVTAPTSGRYYTLFAFREEPAFFYFDDASVTAVGSTTNLLTNPGFEDGSTASTRSSSVQVPNGWGTVYQTGTVPGAPGTVTNGEGSHSGSYIWYDGSVESYDGIYQTINTTAGQQYLISFFLQADDPYQTPNIEMATYFGACDAADSSCTTALGDGFTVSRPAASATIDTSHGDISPGVFSLGSAAAQSSPVVFDGGTLRMTGGSFAGNIITSPVTIDANNGTVDTSTGNGGFSGAVSGVGSLTIEGGGTFSLTGANTFGGGVVVNASTVAVGNDSALGTGTLTFNGGALQAVADGISIANAATLAGNATIDTQSFGFSDTGPVGGPGQLTKTGTGTLTLSGANTYTGGTVLQSGTLAVGNSGALGTGPLSMDDGTTLRFVADGLTLANAVTFTGTADPTIDTGSGSETISGNITGTGSLTKLGTGTLDLTGTDTYTGPTTVAEGTLLVDGSLTNSAVTVQNGATLGGVGSIASFTVQNGAVLAPGSGGGLRVTGNATFLTGSTYQVTVNPDGTGTRLAVGGTATLNGAGVSVLAGAGTFTPNVSYTILTATAGVSGTFGPISTSTNLALLAPTLSYGADDVVLTLRPVNFAAVAASPNQAATARAIQALGPGSALYNGVVAQDQVGARQAFAAASGVTHASTTAIVQTNTHLSTGLLIDRLWDVSGSGLSAQQVLNQFAPDRLPALVRCYGPVADPVPAAPPPTYTAWGEAFGTFGHSDGGLNAGSLDRSLGGFILGIDTPLSGIFGNAWRGGVAVGYTNTSFQSHLDGGTGTVQGVFGSLYGGARYGAVDIRLGTTVGGNFVDSRRSVAFPGFLETETSSNTGMTVQTFGEIGYRIPTGQMVLEPVAGASFLHVHQDSFRETGGAAALAVSALDNDLGTTTLGVRGEAQPFKTLPIVAHGFLAWQHVIGNVSPATTLAFEAAPANTFAVTGTPIDRNALLAEAALDYRVSSAMDVGLSYVGQVGATAYDHSVKGRIEYRF